DIIFGLTRKELCIAFEKLMHEKFQMSSIRELTFFLGLQVRQKKDGIFISKDIYVGEILKKFGFTEVKTANTPMETQKPLLKDEDGEEVDVHMYRSMLGSLMYLTPSRPKIMFAICACAGYQVNPKVSHLHAVKTIFRYLKSQLKLGLWYPKDSPFDLVAYTDSDYARASLDRKSTKREAEYVAALSCCGQVLWIQNQLLDYGYNFMLTKIFIDHNKKAKKSVRLMMEKLVIRENRQRVLVRKRIKRIGINLLLLLKVNAVRHNLLPLVTVNAVEEQFWSTVKTKTINGEVQLHALVDGKKIIITESTVRRDLQLEDAEGIDCLPNSTIFEQLTLMGYEKISQKLTFYKAFFSPQWKFLIHTILQCLSSKTTAWNEFSSTMASAIICLATNQKFNFSKYIFESMVKNLDNVGKFLMYPRFIQVFLDKQLEGMPTHNRIYIAPSHTKKIFGNIRRVEKGFSRRETPLFQTMVVQDQAEMGEDEAVYKELDNSFVRATTTASSLEAELDNGNIAKTQSKAIPNESSSLGTTSGVSLTTRVESSRDEESLGEDTSKQGRIDAIDDDEDITLVNDQDDADMFDLNTLTGDDVLAEQEVATEDVNLTVDEVTLAQALVALKSVKPKVKANVVEESSVLVSAASTKVSVSSTNVSAATTTTTATILTLRKGIVITKLAEINEDERLAREKDEANVALTKEWDDIQAKVYGDYQLAQRLQAEEQEQFTTEQKATLFKELLEQRRKHFATKRAEEKRNKPPTKTQQKKTMITYLKNMKGWKHKDLKSKDSDSIKELFNKAFKRVNMFMDYRTDLVEGSLKRSRDELEQEVTKKQKVDDVQETAKVDDVQETAEVDDDQEATKIKELMEIVHDEDEVAINAIPLATKPPTIVDWKIHKEGKKNYYQIIRADGSSKMYLVLSHMLKSFD
ncbi:putative ribonuclease H-like domain-containing protein, partial [Tanacetum coccineum]